MQVKFNNNPQTFGWHYRMHRTILLDALRESKMITPEIKEILAKSVETPDFDEFFLYGQKHFYYPNSRLKSFFDITGTHNAKALYLKHIQQMFNGENFFESAGKALHYLHDITQPNHIEAGSILRKARDAKMHHQFEMQAYDNEAELIKNAIPVNTNATSFTDLFELVLRLSALNEVPNRLNSSNWYNIAQRGVNIAIGSTKNFLELLEKTL